MEIKPEWEKAAYEAYQRSFGGLYGTEKSMTAALAAVAPMIAAEARREDLEEAAKMLVDDKDGIEREAYSGLRESSKRVKGQILDDAQSIEWWIVHTCAARVRVLIDKP